MITLLIADRLLCIDCMVGRGNIPAPTVEHYLERIRDRSSSTTRTLAAVGPAASFGRCTRSLSRRCKALVRSIRLASPLLRQRSEVGYGVQEITIGNEQIMIPHEAELDAA